MNAFETTMSRYQPQALSILRIMFGLLFLQHGLVKWFGFPVANPMFANIQLFSLVGVAGLIEVIGGLLVTAGLFTRAAAFVMSGQMAVAYFMTKAAKGFFPIVNGGNLDIAYCFAFLYLAFAGAGPWSLDATVRKRG